VIDDGSLGCIPPRPIIDNVWDEFDPHRRERLPVAQVFPDVVERQAAAYTHGSQEKPSCVARSRFREVDRIIVRNACRGWRLLSTYYHHGRRRYWHLVHVAHSLLWAQARERRVAYFVFLPDDVRLPLNFFGRAVAAWESIADPAKRTLMVHIEASRENVAVWTDLEPQRISESLSRIGWVESANFITDVRLLEFLNWTFPRISPRRWVDNPPISSGVGAFLSEAIHSAGYSMYLTHRSLVAHVGVALSKMNSAFRVRGRKYHVTLRFVDGDDTYHRLLREAATVTASIASVWTREIALHAAVDSLAHQVDRINVYLNGYDHVPAYLRKPYVNVLLSKDTGKGDIGDVGKFYWANQIQTEYHLTADDDIIYPEDYVARLVRFRENFRGRPVVLGVHGICVRPDSLESARGARRYGYYSSRTVFMGVGEVPSATVVHILGTGTVMYRVADFGELNLDADFSVPNMADIWFGVLGQRKAIPFVVMPHEAGWITEFPGTAHDSLYRRYTRRRYADRRQTAAVLAAAPWVTHSNGPHDSVGGPAHGGGDISIKRCG
jgi:hypothetical protein